MLDRMEQQKEGPMSSSLVLEHLAMQERAIEIEEEFVDDAPEQYRAVSGLAVFSLVIAVLSLPALLLPLPVSVLFLGGAILATVLGLVAARTIRQRPDELLGSSVAWTGAILGAGTLAASIAWNAYVTATEVPEGYTRVSFYELQPNGKAPDLPYSKRALELDGKRIYIKGYTYPSDQRHGLKRFILVRDQGTCCFGGQPKPTHMADVVFTNGLTIDYSFMQRGIGGILRVDKEPRHGSLGGTYFRIEADHLR
jgi:hypothetical protein